MRFGAAKRRAVRPERQRQPQQRSQHPFCRVISSAKPVADPERCRGLAGLAATRPGKRAPGTTARLTKMGTRTPDCEGGVRQFACGLGKGRCQDAD
jgi:hypothetical protein